MSLTKHSYNTTKGGWGPLRAVSELDALGATFQAGNSGFLPLTTSAAAATARHALHSNGCAKVTLPAETLQPPVEDVAEASSDLTDWTLGAAVRTESCGRPPGGLAPQGPAADMLPLNIAASCWQVCCVHQSEGFSYSGGSLWNVPPGSQTTETRAAFFNIRLLV